MCITRLQQAQVTLCACHRTTVSGAGSCALEACLCSLYSCVITAQQTQTDTMPKPWQALGACMQIILRRARRNCRTLSRPARTWIWGDCSSPTANRHGHVVACAVCLLQVNNPPAMLIMRSVENAALNHPTAQRMSSQPSTK